LKLFRRIEEKEREEKDSLWPHPIQGKKSEFFSIAGRGKKKNPRSILTRAVRRRKRKIFSLLEFLWKKGKESGGTKTPVILQSVEGRIPRSERAAVRIDYQGGN